MLTKILVTLLALAALPTFMFVAPFMMAAAFIIGIVEVWRGNV